MKIKIINLRIIPFIRYEIKVAYIRNGVELFRRKTLKEPQAAYNAAFDLKVYATNSVGQVWIDEHAQKYMVTSFIIDHCIMKPLVPFTTDCINIPTELKRIK